tara:strand:- start:352 stop:2064 length:1713 start_codon:yes stop_codon:yes gene_type:complete
MGAYEDVAKINETAGQITAQYLNKSTQSWIDSISKINAQEVKKNKAASDERIRVQRVGYEVDKRAWEKANKNFIEVGEKDPMITEQYIDKVGVLLRGVGEVGDENYQIGAIDAETMLATKSGLTNEDREYLNTVVQKAKNFQNYAISGGGKILSDLEDMSKVRPSDLNSTHHWVGANQVEQDTSMYTAYGLGDKQVNGLSTTKELIAGDKGEMIVKVTSNIKEGSEAWNNLSEASKIQVKKNGGSLVWERNINEWNTGLIAEMADGLDVDKVAESSGLMNKKGDIELPYLIGGENSNVTVYEPMPGKAGVERYTTVNYLNINRLKDPAKSGFLGDINGKASAVEAMGPGELQAFVNIKMKGGPDYYKDNIEGKTEQERIKNISELLEEDFMNTKLAGVIKRPATPKDVENFVRNGFDPIEVGEEVYIQKVSTGQRNIPGYAQDNKGSMNSLQLDNLNTTIDKLTFPRTKDGALDLSLFDNVLSETGWSTAGQVFKNTNDDGKTISTLKVEDQSGKGQPVQINDAMTEYQIRRILAKLKGMSSEEAKTRFPEVIDTGNIPVDGEIPEQLIQ